MEWEKIVHELSFRTSRSSGAGGQHVNKTETRVEVVLDIPDSSGLTEEEKEKIFRKLRAQITDAGMISVSSQRSRSQFANKENAIEKLRAKLQKALEPERKRVRTGPSQASIEERLTEKKKRSEKKEARKKPDIR